MKNYPLISAWLLIFSSVLFSAPAKDNSVAAQALMIVKTAAKYHYAPRTVDDSLSKLVYKSFFHILDPYGVYFAEEQVRALESYKYVLDNQILQKKTTFLDTATSLFTMQINSADSLIRSIAKKGIIFSDNDTLWLGGDSIFCSRSRLSQRWQQWMTYLVLWTFHARADSTKPARQPTSEQARKLLADVIERETCRIRQKLDTPGGIRTLTDLAYLKAIASAFDAHTMYMSSSEKSLFETELSTTAGSFGLRVNLNILGEIEIIEVVPGGPAWTSGKINDGDVLLAVETAGGKSLDLRCATPGAVYSLLSPSNCTKAEFAIRKKNGKMVRIVLKKELLDVEENAVKSFLIGDSADIAYIYLPSFYTNFIYFHYLSKGCANDIGKELIKLRADSIRGLILDLRSNGGGSMQEAFRTAGAFVNEGALCIIGSREKGPTTVKDHARGAVYKGPMVVLVNSSSASAAELLAAVLQDNNRAVIAGSRTFGKATMQSIIPVNAGEFDSLSHYKGDPPGFLTITNGCVYRASGESHQKTGVTPDIELPDLFENIEEKEASLDGCLQLPKIVKKTYCYPEEPLPIDNLKAQSSARMKTSMAFKYIQKIAPEIPRANARYPVPLSYASYIEYADRFSRMADSLDALACSLNVTLPSYLALKAADKDPGKEDLREIMHEISTDIYIYEATEIIHDLIHIQKQGKSREK